MIEQAATDDHTQLAENHERIWLGPLCQVDERCWCEDPQPCDECGLPAIEYIRADIAAARAPQAAAEGEVKQMLAKLDNADRGHSYLASEAAALIRRLVAERDGLAQGLAYQESLVPAEEVAHLRAELTAQNDRLLAAAAEMDRRNAEVERQREANELLLDAFSEMAAKLGAAPPAKEGIQHEQAADGDAAGRADPAGGGGQADDGAGVGARLGAGVAA